MVAAVGGIVDQINRFCEFVLKWRTGGICGAGTTIVELIDGHADSESRFHSSGKSLESNLTFIAFRTLSEVSVVGRESPDIDSRSEKVVSVGKGEKVIGLETIVKA